MTNFEHMKGLILKTVSMLDEAELRQLVNDTYMDENWTEDIFSCRLCEYFA